MTCKSPRITEAAEIILKQQKHKSPGVGQYNTKLSEKLLFGYVPKVSRVSYIDEALHLGSECPVVNDISYKLIDKKTKEYSFSPLKEEKEEEKKEKLKPTPSPA